MLGAQLDNYTQDIIPNSYDNPKDTVTSLVWHPEEGEVFACSSWDSTIRVYAKGSNNSLSLRTNISTQDPFLSIGWMHTSFLVGGCIDGFISFFDFEGSLSNTRDMIEHKDAVKSVYSVDHPPLLVSLSYDKTLKIWDLRMQKSVKTIELKGKPYCSDMYDDTIIIGLDSQETQIGDLKDLFSRGSSALQSFDSVFNPGEKFSDVSFLRNGRGFVQSCDSGRGNISKLTMNSPQAITRENVMTWKGHQNSGRPQQILYPMNTVSANPSADGSIVSGGGDGNLFFWNYLIKEKCSTLSFAGQPVTKARFNKDGTLVAYAIGYDYAKGVQGLDSYQTKIGVHVVTPQDLKRERERR